jgi:hypothetical protein
MSYRSAILLLLSALGLWAYLLLWEIKQPDAAAQKESAISVLPQERDSILSLSLSSPTQRLTLSLQGEQWVVSAPVPDVAEPLAVESLLSQLALARASRVFTEEDPSFGINEQSPSLQVVFQNNTKLVLLVGADAVGGALFYAFRSDTKQVLLLPRALKTLLTQDVEKYRAQQALLVRREALEGITVQTPTQMLRLQKRGSLWQQEEPVSGRVDPAKMESLLRELEALRVKSFLPVAPPTPNGVEHKITLQSKEGTQSLSLLGPYQEGGESLYLVKRREALFSMDASLVEGLWSQPDELRDVKLFSDLAEVRQLLFTRGTDRLRLYRGEKTWESEPAGELDTREVDLFREALSRLLVRSFATPNVALPPSTQGVMPSLTLTFADETQQSFLVGGRASEGFVWVQREGEWVEAPEEIIALLTPDPLRFQPKIILKLVPKEISAVTIMKDAREVRLERRGTQWWQTAPFEAIADQRATEGLLLSFEELRAVRFLPKVEQLNIDKPSAQTTLFMKDGKTHTVLLGEVNLAGERFAKIDEQEVCALSNALWLSLGAEWVERRAFLSLEVEGLQGLTLKKQGATVTLKKTLDGWAGTDGQSYSTLIINKYLQDIVDITAEQVVPFEQRLSQQYGLEAAAFSGELQGKSTALSFTLGSLTDELGRVALRLHGTGPLYLLSAEEASYLKFPTTK